MTSSETRYVKSPLVKDADRSSYPEVLTDEKIDEVVAKLKETRGLGKEIRLLSLLQVQQHVRSELQGHLICADYIEYVVSTLIKQYEMAQMIPGQNMIMISEAFMQPLMQATLNTFHKAGLLTQTGYTAMRDLLHVPSKRNEEVIVVNFKERLSKDEIFAMRADFVYRSVDDIIVSTEIDEYDNFEHYVWEDFQRTLSGIEIFEDFVMLRIKLDPKMMIEHGISMISVVQKIKEYCHYVDVVFGPLESGIIDIYGRKSILNSQLFQTAEGQRIRNNTNLRRYYVNVIVPEMKNIDISGIKDILTLYPRDTTVLSAILSSVRLSNWHKDRLPRKSFLRSKDTRQTRDLNIWLIRKNKNITIFEGVTDAHIKKFFEVIGIKVRQITEHTLTVVMPDEIDVSPAQYAKEFMSLESSKIVENNAVNMEKSKLLNELNFHNYCVLTGSNLEEVMKMEMVDRRRTFSNNFHTITGVLGIEAARKYYFYNLQFVLDSTGKIINSRFVDTWSDIIMHRGSPVGISHTGIVKRVAGFFTQLTVHHVKDVLVNNSLHNKTGESTYSTSVAMGTATVPHVRTGTEFGKIPENKPGVKGETNDDVIDSLFEQYMGDENFDNLGDLYPEMKPYYPNKNIKFKPQSDKITRVEILSPMKFEEDKSMFTSEDALRFVVPVVATGTPNFVKNLIEKFSNVEDAYSKLDKEERKRIQDFADIPEFKDIVDSEEESDT